MDENLNEFRKQATQRIQAVCDEYGLYGNVIYHAPSPFTLQDEDNRNRLYIVAGLSPELAKDPPPKWLDPEYLLRRQERNTKLFYPDVWVYDLSNNASDIEALDELVEYTKRAEFISYIYARYQAEIPEKLRLSEVNHLISFFDSTIAFSNTPQLQKRYQKDLDWFFRREKTKFPLRKKWLDYFRSDKFPDDKGIFARIRGFFRRKKPTVALDQLMDTNDEIHKLQMQEYEFKYFRDFMAKCHPDVSYSIGDRSTVNHGITPSALRDKVDVKNVTYEEYAAVRKERFAEEGFESVMDLNPSYWDFREIYYRATDEPIIASVYNMMTLQYAKCNDLSELDRYGEIAMEDIPANNFMNFVSLAKANGVRFYIDNRGDFAIPSFDTIHVVYNECQRDKMDGIIHRLISDKVNHSHALDLPQPTLQRRIDDSRKAAMKSILHAEAIKQIRNTTHRER